MGNVLADGQPKVTIQRRLSNLLPGPLKEFLRDEAVNLRRRSRYPRYERIFRKYRDFTMTGRLLYYANLGLTEQVRRVPGVVIECGVWRGGMIAGIAEILGAERQYYLFDNFEGMPRPQAIDGQKSIQWWLGAQTSDSPFYRNNYVTDESYAHEAMKRSGAHHYQVAKGWFEQTLADFQPDAPIALLRLDAGLYEATMTCLQKLYPLLNTGGIMILDDYYGWEGTSKALHDYLSQEKSADCISQFDGKICFVIKRARAGTAIRQQARLDQ